ncbi:MAG: hypothetical protein LC792_24365, partial [Actinobacteria bacterium]|nr:hypothetical protein [Actinomycetota bacterium]
PGVASGGDTGSPLALADPQSAAGQAFHLLAHRLTTEIMPPVEMSGCTARVFAAANANLAALDAAKAEGHAPGAGEPVAIRPATAGTD